MADKYLPLRKMDELQENVIVLEKIIEELQKNGFPIVENYNEFIEILLKFYMRELDKENYEKIFKILIHTLGDYLSLLYSDNDELYNNLIFELLDCTLLPYLLNIWRYNKQVFKIDKDFCDALIKTENLKISKEMLIHLPCKNFYVDLSDCNLFYPIKGAFVNVFIYENCDKVSLNFILINEELVTWSSYDVLNFTDEKEVCINYKLYKENSDDNEDYIATDLKIQETSNNIYVEKIISNESKKQDSDNLKRSETIFFLYQLLMYLVSHEPQIEESPITKSTYRPPKKDSPIKNKFSEIQMFDIGIRFGKSFREQKRKYKCNTILTRHLENKRKSPIPHFRSAHWQGYWVGKGRVEHIVKWIEPVFVNGEVSNDVVIHKM